MRGADVVAQTLAAAGVRKIFSLSGNQIMPIYDACIDAGIDIVHTRHEAAAVFMADGFAQISGGIGVALVTAAPGAANAVGPLYAVRQSESPVLLLTGDSPRSQDGNGAFQELDQVAITAPLTKRSFRATSPGALGDDIAAAIRTALSGRPGPVHLALPFDIIDGAAPGTEIPSAMAFQPVPAAPTQEAVAAIIAALQAARRPLIITGPTLNRTRSGGLVEALSEGTRVPVITMESPRGLNDPSLGALAKVLARCDLIVSLGKAIDFTLGFGKAAGSACRWIVVDTEIAAQDRARRSLADRLVLLSPADPGAMAKALTQDTSIIGGDPDWFGEVAEWCAERSVPSAAEVTENGGARLTSRTLCTAAQRHVATLRHAIVVCDGGEFGQWAQAEVSGHSRIINGPSGAIGGGLCYAIAAKLAKPEAPVILLTGDGSLGFHLAEFETAVRNNTPFVAIVGNDQRWNAEHQIQLREYGPDRLFGCTLSAMRYDKAVEAMGGHGELVLEVADLNAAIERAFQSDKPACIDVRIEGLPAPAGLGKH